MTSLESDKISEIPMSATLFDEDKKLNRESFITDELDLQLKSFVALAESYNDKLPEYRRRERENYLFLYDFYKKVFNERNKRSEKIETPQYWEIEKLAESQFPVPPYLVLCMDGRVLPPLVFGMTYGIGGSIRVPGGILHDFVRGENGELFLKNDSVYSESLDQAIDKSDVIAQVFDSHIGCAARNAEEESRGAHLDDAGVYRDVMFKKEMADATKKYVDSKDSHSKKVMTIQTSFDPHNGFLFMGLETDAALDFVRKNSTGDEPEFTGEIRHELVEQGKIISTEHLADELSDVFRKYGNFNMDWKGQFLDTAGNFWKSVAEMKAEVSSHIQEKLKTVYPELKQDNDLANKELEERTTLLLTSAFSGYMLNKLNSKPSHEHAEGEVEHAYEYGDHTENFIKVIEGGQPPYDTSAFVLFSLDHKNLVANIELAAQLIRKNRREGRVIDPFGYFKEAGKFEKAIVPVTVHELVRDQFPEDEWQRLSKINWDDLNETDWDTMSNDEFFTYLKTKEIFDHRMMENINNLRHRMMVVMDSDTPLGSHLVDQFKIALPVISGKNRRNYFIVPFFKAGHRQTS